MLETGTKAPAFELRTRTESCTDWRITKEKR